MGSKPGLSDLRQSPATLSRCHADTATALSSWSDNQTLPSLCHSSALLGIRAWHPQRDLKTPSPHLSSTSKACGSHQAPIHAQGLPSLCASSDSPRVFPKVPKLCPGFRVSHALVCLAGGCPRPPTQSFMLHPQQDIPAPAAGDRLTSGLAFGLPV